MASSAASRITPSRRRPVNCLCLFLSGRVKNQDASLLEADCCLAIFRCRREEDRRGSIRATFTPLRSARELFRWLWIGRSWSAFDREFCANLNRSRVEKYWSKRRSVVASAGSTSSSSWGELKEKLKASYVRVRTLRLQVLYFLPFGDWAGCESCMRPIAPLKCAGVVQQHTAT